jgi:hypothetical protein
MKKVYNFDEVYKLPLRADEYAPSMVWTANGFNAFDFLTGVEDDMTWDELMTVKTANQYLDVINGKKESDFEQTFIYDDSYIYWLDNEGKRNGIISIRGWGHLISPSGFNLDSETAIKIQDDFGKFIVKRLNGLS